MWFIVGHYATHALAVLKEKGYRITKPRRLVLELLERTAEGLSPYEMGDLLRENGQEIDTVSIYRIIETLEKHHLVHRLLGSGKLLKCHLEDESHCEKAQHDHCHHFFICTACGAIQEVHCPNLQEVLAVLEAAQGIHITEHSLELRGQCRACYVG
jgi:Fur family transcriptional regulator, zinc uptake regulator